MTRAAAWLAGLVMIAGATSLAGIFLAPIAIPATAVAVRRSHRWSVRIPLLLGAAALAVLVVAWLAGGAGFGSTTSTGTS